jgi:hypothetical protein
LLVQVEVDLERMDLAQEADEVLQRPSEPVDRPRHDHVELPLGRVAAERIELRPPVASLGAADPVVFVDLDYLDAHAAGDIT